MEKIVNFLNELKINNNRDWFNDNKSIFKSHQNDFENFVNKLIVGIKDFDNEIGLLNPKDCIFRIYKDTRFSKDKTPYKTNFGAYISKGGRKSPNAGYYIHIEPNESFAGGGIYNPQPPVLKAIRTDIFEDSQQLKDIIEEKHFKEIFSEIYGEKLKTAPRGFPKDYKDIDLLRFKSYAVIHKFIDKDVISDNFTTKALDIFKLQKKYNDYFNIILKNSNI